MNFSRTYFSRYISYPPFFDFDPDPNLRIIVVIPCYDDEFIFDTLLSLDNADTPKAVVEVIVVVNSAINTPVYIIKKNRGIFETLKKQQESSTYNRFRLLPVLIENVSVKNAGVGNARKTGMDEAVRRFDMLNRPDGIIVSLDADTLVNKDYFIEIEKAFNNDRNTHAFVFQYQHDFDKDKYTSAEIKACTLYEMYLRYYKLALTLTGFPYYFHTIGSCFAVDAVSYVKIGGMSRRQGGEDFYFLHKVTQISSVGEISRILVYPSPRISDRVPFGTGPSISKIIESGEYHVYNFGLFILLKDFYKIIIRIGNSGEIDLNDIPAEFYEFINLNEIERLIMECLSNAQRGKNLIKRLFSKFDAFFIVKFLNFFDGNSNYPPRDIHKNIADMFEYLGVKEYDNMMDKLLELESGK